MIKINEIKNNILSKWKFYDTFSFSNADIVIQRKYKTKYILFKYIKIMNHTT